MMMNSMALTVNRCMDAVCEHVGTVELEAFIYFVRSSSFDYTKWQREHYDTMTPEEIFSQLEEHGAKHPFKGKKAVVI